MKTSLTRRILSTFAAITLLLAIGLFAMTSCVIESGSYDQGSDDANSDVGDSNLGDYKLVIKSCRLAEDYEGKPIAIIKYSFTNNSDDPASFSYAFSDSVYQNGVALNKCYFADDSANYSLDDQSKEIKKGVTLEVEVAYELNDTTTVLEVEVEELFSFNDTIVKKTFKIAK